MRSISSRLALTASLGFASLAAAASAPPTSHARVGGPDRDVLVSFSGGGLFSHTVLSGVTGGLMDRSIAEGNFNDKLATLFGRTRAITSNSGGSWFMSQIVYSPNYLANFEAHRYDWDTLGYLGQAEPLLNADGCLLGDFDLFDLCGAFFNAYGNLYVYDRNWYSLNRDGVFGPWGTAADLAGVYLDPDPAYQATVRNAWAADIDLTWAASIASGGGLLPECQNDILDGAMTFIGDNADPGSVHTNLYLTKTHLPTTPSLLQSPNEPTTIASWVSTDSQPFVWHVNRKLTYRAGNGPFGAGQVPSFLQIPRDISVANLTPLAASSASSAALGMLPTHMDWRMHTHCNLFAQTIEQGLGTIGFGLDIDFFIGVDQNTGEQSMQLFPPSNPELEAGTNTALLAVQRRFALKDGSFSDDTGVAHLLGGLAATGELNADSEPLKILIFESSEGYFFQQAAGTFVPVNTAKLFAGGSTNNRNVLHAPAWVFDSPMPGPGAGEYGWIAYEDFTNENRHGFGTDQIRFFLYRYSTTTYENFFYGVPGGVPVDLMVLHAYIEKDSMISFQVPEATAILMPSYMEMWHYMNDTVYMGAREIANMESIAGPLRSFLGDECPDNPDKWSPGECGCAVADTDTDSDGTPDCNDGCPLDSEKTEPGDCGCGVADTDTDSDGTPDCYDGCPSDPEKTEPGDCGCGDPETDTDGDGTPDCIDSCLGDVNEDGIVDAADLGLVISAWNTDGSISPGTDLNGDGLVDASDLGLLIASWGPCS